MEEEFVGSETTAAVEETKASLALRKLELLKEEVDASVKLVLSEVIKLIVENEKDIHDEIEFICESIRAEYEEED